MDYYRLEEWLFQDISFQRGPSSKDFSLQFSKILKLFPSQMNLNPKDFFTMENFDSIQKFAIFQENLHT